MQIAKKHKEAVKAINETKRGRKYNRPWLTMGIGEFFFAEDSSIVGSANIKHAPRRYSTQKIRAGRYKITRVK